jgi:hypothetical protein
MRNIFDQYKQHENRLTHALVCCLGADRALLHSFIGWSTDVAAPKATHLQIVEQRLPGESEIDEVEADRRGLPDAWIFAESGWTLLIESKVSSEINVGQINHHLRTAERRGFSDRRLVLITVTDANHSLPRNVTHRTWASVYKWATTQIRRSEWAKRLTGYMEVAERRMLVDEYLTEGTLTTFSGIQFDTENPYSYLEAKRALNLLMTELRKRQSLAKKLGANLVSEGRSAITGKQSDGVWDYIPLAKASGRINFTSHPHLTLAIERERAIVQITIPNSVDRSLRKALLIGGYDGFKEMVHAFVKNVSTILKTDDGAHPFVMILQRHYPSQRSTPVRDATLEFDPRTAIGSKTNVKVQEEWLRATFQAFSKRSSNLQIGIGLAFPYRSSSTVNNASFSSIAELSWLACRPVLATMRLVGQPKKKTL